MSTGIENIPAINVHPLVQLMNPIVNLGAMGVICFLVLYQHPKDRADARADFKEITVEFAKTQAAMVEAINKLTQEIKALETRNKNSFIWFDSPLNFVSLVGEQMWVHFGVPLRELIWLLRGSENG